MMDLLAMSTNYDSPPLQAGGSDLCS
jgi:hypothetical protein